MGKKKKVSLQLDINIELERKNQAPNPKLTLEYKVNKSPNEIFESRNYIKNY